VCVCVCARAKESLEFPKGTAAVLAAAAAAGQAALLLGLLSCRCQSCAVLVKMPVDM